MKPAKVRSDSSEQTASCAPKQEENNEASSGGELSTTSGSALAGASEHWRTRLQFDECDRALVESRGWSVNGNTRRGLYVYSRSGLKRGKRYLHLLIAGRVPGMVVDHINGDTLDNRRCNLRHIPQSHNSQSQHVRRGKSLYQGVSCCVGKPTPWYAKIERAHRQYGLGHFHTEVEAAARYDAAARILFGPGAKINLRTEPSAAEIEAAALIIARYQARWSGRPA